MTRSIGVGIIGMGWMGQVHSRAYNQIKDRFYGADFLPRLIICADTLEARAKEAQGRFGFELSTTNWQDVLQNPEVEVVNITAPNGMHLELNKAAAAAGKHIMCEKPVGRFPSETIASYEAVKDTGLRTFVGYNYRWAPLVQYARQLIQDGELGTLTHYHGRFLNGYASDPMGFLSWRFEQEQGLGTLGDLMSHVIDMAHMLVGPVNKLVSSRETFIRERPIQTPGTGTHYDIATGNEPMGQVTNEDYVNAILRFENGVQGFIEACRVINGGKCEMSFEIYGTKGALKWNMEKMNQLHFQRRNSENPGQEGYTEILSGPPHPYHGNFNPAWGLPIGYDDTKVIEAYNFLKSVATNQQGEPGFKEAYNVAQIQEAMIRSWENENWQTVNY